MPLLPLDLVLLVGSATAALLLGFLAWSRSRRSIGGTLFGLIALSLSLWTAADWFIRSFPAVSPTQVFLWKLLFEFTVAMAPAYALHVALRISHRRTVGSVILAYVVGLIAFFGLSSHALVAFAGWSFDTAAVLMAAAGVLFLLDVIAFLIAAIELYPVFSGDARLIERRRAAYGIVILTLYLTAAALQVITIPIPGDMLLPALTSLFCIISLAAFVRASLLDVSVGALEAFFVFLLTFAIILLLVAHDPREFTVSLLGSVALGTFGFIAIRSARGERMKRLLLEEANHRLRQLGEAESDFVDMVSHQLRTPLGAIRSGASMLSSGDFGALPEQAVKMTAQIQDQATRLLDLAETFLDMSRVETGQYTTRPQPTDVRAELATVVQEMQMFANGKHLELGARAEASVSASVRIDRQAFRNALFNLVDNAIKYTDDGGVSVTCLVDDGRLVCEVRDTGAGMTDADIHELFAKFHRGRTAHARALDGTGLGLYVVKRLVHAAGGGVEVESDGPGKGSVFRFHLPIVPDATPPGEAS